MSNDSPRWVHDCPKCVFLGHYVEDSAAVDLYWCKQIIGGPTVIARYSDSGPDYSSGMVFADNGSVPSLVEAKRRAVEKGLEV